MKKAIGLLLMMCLWMGTALAQDAGTKKASKGGSTADQLKQLEHEWTEAQKAGDTAKMSTFIADDWSAFGPDGTKMTKQQYLATFTSGDQKYESVEVGDLDVLVSGDIGIVQGSDNEKSAYKGKDTSGKYVWMDVFQKKNGKWQAVRSEVTKVS